MLCEPNLTNEQERARMRRRHDDLSEGSSNLYYTDARVDARVSGGSLGNITTTGYIRGPASFTISTPQRMEMIQEPS